MPILSVTRQHSLIKPASAHDALRLTRLLDSVEHVHLHHDWQSVYFWLGRKPFYVATDSGDLVGAFAAPPNPPDTAWLRLAAIARHDNVKATLNALWEHSLTDLSAMGVRVVACMVIAPWLEPYLINWQFTYANSVVGLALSLRELSPAAHASFSPPHRQLSIRPATAQDAPAITKIDNAAFASPWQYSETTIVEALAYGTVASVAEWDGQTVGYQICSGNARGGHLARLAVLPQWQGRGIGKALVAAAVSYFIHLGSDVLTVNTQEDNLSSQLLYRAYGFAPLDERYPVWQYAVPGNSSATVQ